MSHIDLLTRWVESCRFLSGLKVLLLEQELLPWSSRSMVVTVDAGVLSCPGMAPELFLNISTNSCCNVDFCMYFITYLWWSFQHVFIFSVTIPAYQSHMFLMLWFILSLYVVFNSSVVLWWNHRHHVSYPPSVRCWRCFCSVKPPFSK